MDGKSEVMFIIIGKSHLNALQAPERMAGESFDSKVHNLSLFCIRIIYVFPSSD